MKKIVLFLSAVFMLGLTSCLKTDDIKEVPVPSEIYYYADCRFIFMNYTVLTDHALSMTKLAINNPTGTEVPKGIELIPTYDDDEILTNLVVKYTDYADKRYNGKMKIAFTGTPLTDGSVMTITSDSLLYSGLLFDGILTVTYNVSDENVISQRIQVANGRLTDSNGLYIGWNCDLNRVFSEGTNKTSTDDDTYTYTGKGSGSTIYIKADFEMEITEPLVITDGYVYFEKGKLSMKPSTYLEPFYIGFGLGTSFNQVFLIYSGVSGLYNI